MSIPDLEDIVSRFLDEQVAEVEFLGEEDGGEQVIFAIPQQWQIALAGVEETGVHDVAVAFRRDPQNLVHGNPDPLTTDKSVAASVLVISDLARTTLAANLKLYCWLSCSGWR